MKDVPIKFRIKTDGDKYLYFTPSLNGDYDQLVGYDAEGNEVYEGDTLINNHDDKFVAKMFVYPCVEISRKVDDNV